MIFLPFPPVREAAVVWPSRYSRLARFLGAVGLVVAWFVAAALRLCRFVLIVAAVPLALVAGLLMLAGLLAVGLCWGVLHLAMLCRVTAADVATPPMEEAA